MTAAAAPPPIVGTSVDPPPREVPGYAERLDRTVVGGIVYRAMKRYTYAHVGLLSSGTAYYLFLSLFSLLAVAYGVFAIVEADRLAQVLTDALGMHCPGWSGTTGSTLTSFARPVARRASSASCSCSTPGSARSVAPAARCT